MGAYPIEITPDDNDTFLVTSPWFPELTTFGETRPRALDAAQQALDEAIAARMARGEDIPLPSGYATLGRDFVRLSDLTALKVQLYLTLRQRGLTRADLARLLGWHREQVDRLFRLGHASRIDQIGAAFRAMDRELIFGVAEAPPEAFQRDEATA